jgi:hypothetical protein
MATQTLSIAEFEEIYDVNFATKALRVQNIEFSDDGATVSHSLPFHANTRLIRLATTAPCWIMVYPHTTDEGSIVPSEETGIILLNTETELFSVRGFQKIAVKFSTDFGSL